MQKLLTSLCIASLSFLILVPFAVQAAEPTACAFGLLQCDENGVVWDLATTSGASNVAQIGANDGLSEVIIDISSFLNTSVFPLLFALGVFFFLYNVARGFIIQVGNEEAQIKAKSNTIWGFAAFILIVSLWGIVNIFTGIDAIDREQSLCPDYLGNFCGNMGGNQNQNSFGGGGGWTPGTSNGPTNSGGGAGAGGGGGGGASSPAQNTSKLGELLFGQYEEIVDFSFRAGLPRGMASTVTLPETLSCADGLNTLQFAADTESAIGSYALYKLSGQTRFVNTTDANSPTYIQHDADVINELILDGGTDIHIVHTHPQNPINALNLNMTGYAPTPADLTATCSGVGGAANHIVVDSGNVWVINISEATCPRQSNAEDDLIAISVLLQLAIMDSADRNFEFDSLYSWSGLRSAVSGIIESYADTDFSAMTNGQIITMADNLARNGDMTVSRTSVNGFCTSF